MGKGDKKSKKGKLWKGSYGNSRRKTTIKARVHRKFVTKPVEAVAAQVAEVVEVKPKAKRTTKKKTEGVE